MTTRRTIILANYDNRQYICGCIDNSTYIDNRYNVLFVVEKTNLLHKYPEECQETGVLYQKKRVCFLSVIAEETAKTSSN